MVEDTKGRVNRASVKGSNLNKRKSLLSLERGKQRFGYRQIWRERNNSHTVSVSNVVNIGNTININKSSLESIVIFKECKEYWDLVWKLLPSFFLPFLPSFLPSRSGFLESAFMPLKLFLNSPMAFWFPDLTHSSVFIWPLLVFYTNLLPILEISDMPLS